jgi:hypothetical protein
MNAAYRLAASRYRFGDELASSVIHGVGIFACRPAACGTFWRCCSM